MRLRPLKLAANEKQIPQFVGSSDHALLEGSYKTCTSTPGERSPRSNVTSLRPATAKGDKVCISPYLRRRTAPRREPTKLRLDGLGLSEQRYPVVGADFIPKGPRLGHCLYITPHNHWGCQRSKNRDLRDSTEEELFFAGTFKPCSSPLRVDVAAPEKRQPDVGVKEIQDVHRSARWSDPPSDHPRQSTETSLGGSEDACLPRG